MSQLLARTLAATAVLCLTLTACGGGVPDTGAPAPAAPDPLDTAPTAELVERARQEGQVVVYSFTSRIAQVEAEFERTYPGVDLLATDISSTEQIARIRAEAEAGSPGADVAYLSDAPVVLDELLAEGTVRNYVPPRIAGSVPDRFREPLLASRLSTKTLMYNEEAHPAGPPVTNLWELTDPQWRGRVVMVDPQVRGDYLDLMTEVVLRSPEMDEAHRALRGGPVVLGDGIGSAGEQWIADLYANDVVLVGDTDEVNAAVGARGQQDPPVGFTTYSDRRDNEDENRALQAATGVAPAPGIAFPALLGVTPDAAHPAAARLLVDFLMGDGSPDGGPGFAPFYVPGDYPTRTDVVPPSGAVPLAELGAWTIDPAVVAGRRGDVADLILTLG
ncbi:iron ABC transporter substrate-binding protein [Pseudonocardia sp. EC080610-09]|uniref:ABC transporter substrate-binding protein n=1 Tax=unclassified Pseudonocardia TaxID=2619320 RepID=UPI0006CB0EB4|nr:MULTISPECIES: ABC transporter substrate-binding protein [unclassified Pseudonocardia]ALE73800.1 iron ABC transporter substrate-binding protein [Pseudonocardia sp. EC080625-04]ALL77195.1 iron ABC transporter substrate-binding protein [Pseudonocardia sp. EC080610-09]ALL80109.1 iron ABC transporter substrate-binding protein [Pseudonocardia sp. EC080619-01]